MQRGAIAPDSQSVRAAKLLVQSGSACAEIVGLPLAGLVVGREGDAQNDSPGSCQLHGATNYRIAQCSSLLPKKGHQRRQE